MYLDRIIYVVFCNVSSSNRIKISTHWEETVLLSSPGRYRLGEVLIKRQASSAVSNECDGKTASMLAYFSG